MGTQKNELVHRHARKFFAGQPSSKPQIFNALLLTFVMRWNQANDGEAFRLPGFMPSCKVLMGRDLGTEEPHPMILPVETEDDSVSKIVSSAQSLQQTHQLLREKSAAFNFVGLLYDAKKYSTPCNSNTFYSSTVLTKYGLSIVPSFMKGYPEMSAIDCASSCLQSNKNELVEILHWPLEETGSPQESEDFKLFLKNKVLSEMREKKWKYLNQEVMDSTEYDEEIRKIQSGKEGLLTDQVLKALSNLLSLPMLVLSADTAREVQLILPAQQKYSCPMILWSDDGSQFYRLQFSKKT